MPVEGEEGKVAESSATRKASQKEARTQPAPHLSSSLPNSGGFHANGQDRELSYRNLAGGGEEEGMWGAFWNMTLPKVGNNLSSSAQSLSQTSQNMSSHFNFPKCSYSDNAVESSSILGWSLNV